METSAVCGGRIVEKIKFIKDVTVKAEEAIMSGSYNVDTFYNILTSRPDITIAEAESIIRDFDRKLANACRKDEKLVEMQAKIIKSV